MDHAQFRGLKGHVVVGLLVDAISALRFEAILISSAISEVNGSIRPVMLFDSVIFCFEFLEALLSNKFESLSFLFGYINKI